MRKTISTHHHGAMILAIEWLIVIFLRAKKTPLNEGRFLERVVFFSTAYRDLETVNTKLGSSLFAESELSTSE